MPVVSAQCDAQPKEVYYFQKLADLIIIRIFVFYDRNHSVAVAHRLHAPGGRDHACHIRFSASDWWVKLSITARGAGLVSSLNRWKWLAQMERNDGCFFRDPENREAAKCICHIHGYVSSANGPVRNEYNHSPWNGPSRRSDPSCLQMLFVCSQT